MAPPGTKRHHGYSRCMPTGYEVRISTPAGTAFYIIQIAGARTIASRPRAEVNRWLRPERRPQIFASICRHALWQEREDRMRQERSKNKKKEEG